MTSSCHNTTKIIISKKLSRKYQILTLIRFKITSNTSFLSVKILKSCWQRDEKYGLRDEKYGLRDAKYGLRDAKYGLSQNNIT